jgi:hypothetical protein
MPSSRSPQGGVKVNLDDLLREVIASGKLHEPFSAMEATRALSIDDWSLPRVHSFLVRHCIGNLAASTLLVERVTFGKYRLIYDGPREPADNNGTGEGAVNGSSHREPPISPGDPES